MVPKPPLPQSTPFTKWQTSPAPSVEDDATTTAPPPLRHAGAAVAPRRTGPCSAKSRHHPLLLPAVNMQCPGPRVNSFVSALSVAIVALQAATAIAPPAGTSFRLVAAAFQAKMVTSPAQAVSPVDMPQPISCLTIGPTHGRTNFLQPHPVVVRRFASACGRRCGREAVGRRPLGRRLDVAPARSLVSLLASLPTLVEEWRLRGKMRELTGR